jgi:hypothetical protein
MDGPRSSNEIDEGGTLSAQPAEDAVGAVVGASTLSSLLLLTVIVEDVYSVVGFPPVSPPLSSEGCSKSLIGLILATFGGAGPSSFGDGMGGTDSASYNNHTRKCT